MFTKLREGMFTKTDKKKKKIMKRKIEVRHQINTEKSKSRENKTQKEILKKYMGTKL